MNPSYLNLVFLVNFILEFGLGVINLFTGGSFLLPPRYLRESDGARLMSEMLTIAIMSMGLLSLACWILDDRKLKCGAALAFAFYHTTVTMNTIWRASKDLIVDGPNPDENPERNIEIAVIGIIIHTVMTIWLFVYCDKIALA